jgi:hypothetical protein
METLKFCFLFAVFVLVNSLSVKHESFAAFLAIKAILSDHFAANEPQVDLFFCGPTSAELANKLLRERPPETSFKVIKLDTVQEIEIDSPSIFLFDSTWHYEIFDMHNNFSENVKENQIVFIGNASIDYLAQNGLDQNQQNFIRVVNGTTVDFVTSFRFSPGNCNVNVYKTTNQFSTDTMRWQSPTFFPEKYRNFHNCSLSLAHWPQLTYYVDRSASFVLFEQLAQNLNFRIKRDDLPSSPDNINGYDLIEFYHFQHIGYLFFEFSSAIFDDFLTFTIPAGEPYSQLEKMFLMFDKETWICIGVTLAGSLLVIQVINCMSIQVQRFVFGRDVRTPTLNVANIFLNGSQIRLPGRNFARFILTLFIIWALIIRTCYQSELYKNLQTDMRRPRVKTIDEMNEKNFTLVYANGDEDFFDEIKSKR